MLEKYAPELLLVSAGFDAHEDDPLASMRMTTAGYAAVVKSLADVAARIGCPMALVTEGGYDPRRAPRMPGRDSRRLGPDII